MIEAKELRIGNKYLYLNPENEWVESTIKWQEIKDAIENEKDWLDNNNPIPLTKEWLIKFGFEILPNGYDNTFSITIEKNWCELVVEDDMTSGIKDISLKSSGSVSCLSSRATTYVHQLQNLYFSLTGKELTIKS